MLVKYSFSFPVCFLLSALMLYVCLHANNHSQCTTQQVGSVPTVCLFILPPPFWLVGFRFSLQVSLGTFFYSFSISFTFQQACRKWLILDLWTYFCSCAFSWLKEKIFVLIYSHQSVFLCIVTVTHSLACCDLCCFCYTRKVLGLYYVDIIAFRLMLNARHVVNVKNRWAINILVSCILNLITCYEYSLNASRRSLFHVTSIKRASDQSLHCLN